MEEIMSSRKPNKRKELKVIVCFEISRVADKCLADAYEQVVPLVSRPTQAGGQSANVDTTPPSVEPEESRWFEQLDSGYCDSVTNSNRRAAT